jgi:hypothetical protein
MIEKLKMKYLHSFIWNIVLLQYRLPLGMEAKLTVELN